ncbi:MAG: phosphoribosylformylglycinamidine synthase subunit PurQ [Planctomycetota bacterium]
MSCPKVLILRAPGTNCDQETAFAFEMAGATTETLHVNRMLESPALLDQFQILCIPGGFSFGDDVAAGQIFAVQMRHHLAGRLADFKAAGKLILGICNGFQVIIKSGILLDDEPPHGPPATLTYNDSGKYEDRWVRLGVASKKCVFLRGIEQMYLPVAHGEGKFIARDVATLARLEAAGQLALRYTPLAPGGRGQGAGSREQGESKIQQPPLAPHPGAGGEGFQAGGHLPFPDNPNGSMADVAGVCDATGRVLGLMPHPERHLDPTHHPRWTRGEAGPVGDGLKVFINAVQYFG